jgi:hypothetical protein
MKLELNELNLAQGNSNASKDSFSDPSLGFLASNGLKRVMLHFIRDLFKI